MIVTDITDFLDEEIRGPASFTCKSGQNCRFEEPAMNDLIDQIFGDAYITLSCQSGECMHYTQVPGYVVSLRKSNSARFDKPQLNLQLAPRTAK